MAQKRPSCGGGAGGQPGEGGGGADGKKGGASAMEAVEHLTTRPGISLQQATDDGGTELHIPPNEKAAGTLMRRRKVVLRTKAEEAEPSKFLNVFTSTCKVLVILGLCVLFLLIAVYTYLLA